MIHIAVAGITPSALCVGLAMASVIVPGAPPVDAFLVAGTVALCVVSGVFFWYVRRERL